MRSREYEIQVRIIYFLGFMLIASACRSASGVAPTEISSTATAPVPAATATPLPVTPSLMPVPASPTTEPTSTVAPVDTSTPLPTATEAPPVPLARVVSEVAEIREGPNEVYLVVGYYAKGVDLPVLGRNAEADWLLVDLGLGQSGWIAQNQLLIEFDPQMVPITEAPPTPTVPPPYILAWIERDGNDLYDLLFVQLFNFLPGENVEIVFTRSQNGIVDSSRTVVFSKSGSNLHVYNTINNIISGMTYVISATGDQGSSAQTSITIP